MSSENQKQNLIDFLSRDKSFDMESFVKEVNQDQHLLRTLRDLDRISMVRADMSKEILWQRIVKEFQIRRRRLIHRWSVAAAIILPICCISIFFQNEISNQEQLLLADGHSRQVQLFMPNGEVLELTKLDSGTCIRKGNANIHLNGKKGMDYVNEEKSALPFYHTLLVPRGNEFHLVLPDGTKVWLNSDSELKFPSNFVDGERKVFLKGEGYFDVVKDPKNPFRVVAADVQLEVLGTCFNVNTFRDDGNLTATLVEGKVKIRDTVSGQECVLRPNQQMLLDRNGMKIRDIQADDAIAWMDGCFLFKEMPLGLIAKQLERWFDIQFIFQENGLRAHAFTGVINRYDSLDLIFSNIEETTNIKFEKRDKMVTVCYRK